MWQRGSGSHDSHGSGAHGHGDHEHGAHHEHHEHLERGQSLSHLEHHTNHDDTYLNLNSCWGGARTQQCCIDVSYFVKDKGITFSFKWHTAGLLDISWILGNLRKPEDSMSDVGLALISSGTTIFLAMISAIFAMRNLDFWVNPWGTAGWGLGCVLDRGNPTHLVSKITSNRSKGPSTGD